MGLNDRIHGWLDKHEVIKLFLLLAIIILGQLAIAK